MHTSARRFGGGFGPRAPHSKDDNERDDEDYRPARHLLLSVVHRLRACGSRPQRSRPQRSQPQRSQPQRSQPQRSQPQRSQPQIRVGKRLQPSVSIPTEKSIRIPSGSRLDPVRIPLGSRSDPMKDDHLSRAEPFRLEDRLGVLQVLCHCRSLGRRDAGDVADFGCGGGMRRWDAEVGCGGGMRRWDAEVGRGARVRRLSATLGSIGVEPPCCPMAWIPRIRCVPDPTHPWRIWSDARAAYLG
jgi:hypothetical protein